MADTDELLGPDGQTEPSAPRPKAPPIESRFLYVDVAAMRAKQLRRGALPRLSADDDAAGTDHSPSRVFASSHRSSAAAGILIERPTLIDGRMPAAAIS